MKKGPIEIDFKKKNTFKNFILRQNKKEKLT